MLASNPHFPPFSRQEYERRHRMIRSAMEAKGLDCLVIFGGDHVFGNDRGAPNASYVSNYVSSAPVCYVVFPVREEPTLVVRFGVYLDNARDIAAVEDVRAGEDGMEVAVGERLQELGVAKGKIGLVGSGVTFPNYTLPFEHHQYLTKTFPQAQFENVSSWYEELRLVKSEEEIRLMAKAGDLTSAAYEEMILSTRPGARHSDLRASVESLTARLGGTYPLLHLGSTPMSNPHMHYPDPFPTHRVVEAGHVVMTECAVGLGAYSCKIMGTYFVGEPTEQYRRMFEVAASVYERAVAELKPGMTGRDTKRFLEPVQAAGYAWHGNLIMGWANYLERPQVGAVPGSAGSSKERPADLDFVFKPGHCVYVTGRAGTPDFRAEVWVGASCVFTENGLRKLVKHPVSELRVV